MVPEPSDQELSPDAQEFLTHDSKRLNVTTILTLAKELQKEQDWSQLIDLSQCLIKQKMEYPKLAALYVMALRATSGQLEAMRYLGDRLSWLTDVTLWVQWAALLSELGDFGAVANLPQPSGYEKRNDTLDVVILLAWAHENLTGLNHTTLCKSLYRQALSDWRNLTEEELKSYVSPHPSARIGPHAGSRNIRDLNILWLQRGYGDAIAASGGEVELARAEWNQVIDRAASLSPEAQLDPYVQRMTAWCHFRLEQYDDALEIYRVAMDWGPAKYRSQFDRALVLFVVGRVSASLDQYEKAIYDLRDLPPINRCGLCRVALHQLATTIFANPELGSHKYALEIAKGLDADLGIVLSILDKTLPARAHSIKGGVESEFNELHSELLIRSIDSRKRIPIIDWSTAKIVGFQDPGSALCGLLSPVVNYEGSAANALLAEKDESGHVAPLDDMPASIRPVLPTRLPSTTTKILYVSEAAERIVRKWQLGTSLFDKAAWIAKSGGTEELGRAGCIERKIGILELDLMAKELVWKAFSILCGFLSEPEPHLGENSALLGFFAAQRQETMYQASLVYLATSQEPIDLRLVRFDHLNTLLPSAERLSELSKAFLALVRSIPVSALEQLESNSVSALADSVIGRARQISSITDDDERSQEAIWAASEIQLLTAKNRHIAPAQKQLAQIVPRSTIWYLSHTVDTVALAQEPAFYCAMKQSNLSRPAMDVFSYFRAPSVSNLTNFDEGPIAVRARRAS